MRRVCRIVALLAIGVTIVGSLCWPATAASIHALVVGIDEYDVNRPLHGAAADANDIAGAVRPLGPKTLTLLVNRTATRARILQEMDALLANASAGDLIIFTYAGHGGQEDWRGAGGKLEKAESFLLSGFNPSAKRTQERLLDKEINGWLKRAGERGLRVILVADSCHSGGMTREIHPLAGSGEATRAMPPYGIPETLLTSADLRAGQGVELRDLPHVTFLAAAQAGRLSPEVMIEGRPRGALSYAFARALEGAADREGHGNLSHGDLAQYVSVTVRALSESRQTPEITFRSGAESDTLIVGLPKAKQPSDGSPTLRVRLANASDNLRSQLQARLHGAAIVLDGATDLIWDAEAKIVVSGHGDVVAEAVTDARLQGVIDKWRTLEAIKKLVAGHPLAVTLQPGNARHKSGSEISLQTAPLQFPYVSVFNLAPDGSIQYLYPRKDDISAEKSRRLGDRYSLRLMVTPPLGAEHVVVLATQHPRIALHSQLRANPAVRDLPKLLQGNLQVGTYAIGLQGLYTGDGK